MKLKRQTWNNILILSVVVFFGLMLLPDYLRHQRQARATPEGVIALVESRSDVLSLRFSHLTLTRTLEGWQSDKPLVISPTELAQRWLGLTGTQIDDTTLQSLRPQLTSPRTLELTRSPDQEPIRITYYQQPQFWLMQNEHGQWLAVSVDSRYLFPLSKS
ncbi:MULTISPECIES: hypothetical protein [Salinivibrio]|uniref:hypothetical protein n=1 Tax=Salinivibrio TaxID=51366 RepID=UPI0008481619|nr:MULTISPECIES: hypothetical protein [Salinivibrio]ODP97981.1 hypothetical protein BGL48_00680 [Salinivibrio sp. BNH]WBA18074.1 hypothetical protein O4598_00815 [Salinivibrio kushneri]